ncbi:arylsulfatase [Steroidobacter agaridevorans]|uniref:arylsulfatase n=1 Tax=Steroidobacter agaridevorans TaxID=2695856 RepID=UPI0013797F93
MGITRQWCVCLAGILSSCLLCAAESPQQSKPQFQGKNSEIAKVSAPSWPQPIKAPDKAPNVVLILLDDVGFGASSAVGGPVQMPELERLASRGLLYNRFHVTALCSPTRAALLGGRNDHRMGFGTISEVVRGFPGYNGVWKKSTASIADVLRRNGYSTAAFGKWHNTPLSEVTPVGPFDRWPTGLGFEYFYGFLKGNDSQFEPVLHRNTTLIAAPKSPAQGYHFTTDITDEAVRWLRTQESLAADKPYFLYFAPAAAHGPQQVSREWSEKYRGQFSQGWDTLRESIFEREKALGVIPDNARLTSRPKELPAWVSLSPEQKQVYARQMEVYSGFLSHADYEIGRLLREVRAGPRGDNTLIFYIAGDNGADILGGVEIWQPEQAKFELQTVDELGSDRRYNYMVAGWGWATDAPFQWGKGVASHLGGVRVPMVVSWPERIRDSGGIRSQFTDVTDVASTIYEVSGVNMPAYVDGVPQLPLDGLSFAYSFNDASARSRRRTQIFEQLGNRAIYHDGWWASARPTNPWVWARGGYHGQGLDNFDHDRWELYKIDDDFSQAKDLSSRYPEKLEELKKLFDSEASKSDVYPLARYGSGDMPSIISGSRTFTYSPNQLPIQLYGNSVVDFKRSHRISATASIPKQGAEGILLSYGQHHCGFVLYMLDGRLAYEYRSCTRRNEKALTTSNRAVPVGDVELAYQFTSKDSSQQYSSFRRSVQGVGKLFINDELVGEMEVTDFGVPMLGSMMMFGTLDIGQSGASQVSESYKAPFKFTGEINKVTVELK